MGKRELLLMSKRAKIAGFRIGVESTCALIGGAIWNIRADLELTDEQARQIAQAIKPEIEKLEKYCAVGDADEMLDRVEYVTNKAAEMRERMEGNENG